MTTTPTSTLTPRERAEVEAANAGDRRPVVLVHGLWLLAGSWDAWREHLESLGYATVAVDWPGDPATVAEARTDPDALAGVSVGQVTDHVAEVIGALHREPVVIGHSLPLPLSTLRASSPVLTNPANYRRAVSLTFDQFRYAFANAVSTEEAADLYRAFPVPAPGRPLFQAATANVDPRTEASVDTGRADRGPLLVISGEKDHIVPWAVAHAAFKKQFRNAGPTEIVEIPGRGHSLVVDSGWREVADAATMFLARHGAGPDAS